MERDQSRMHNPVLLSEVLDALHPRDGGLYIDATFGFGGHTTAILERSKPSGKVLAIEIDSEVLNFSQKKFVEQFGERIVFFNADYADIEQVASQCGFSEVDGMVLDLGFSSLHVDDHTRGFSFRKAGKLDMRYNRKGDSESAADVLNTSSEEELEKIIRTFGEERFSKTIAHEIVAHRSRKAIGNTMDLVEIVFKAIPKKFQSKHIHPATKTFQAFRIHVNHELDHLKRFLTDFPKILKRGGRAAIISFHSLEDRMVKEMLKKYEKGCICPPDFPRCTCGNVPIMRRVNKKVITASESEVQKNPRSRSAKLRISEKI